jgi:hypothetical protein
MSGKDWKDHLQSSGLPLEYKIAKILVSKGFPVVADYKYGRDSDSGQPKDFSIDILARGYSPFADPNVVDGTLELLIECKHRQEGTKWLFLPDVNQAQYSHIYLGCAPHVYDDFSNYVVDKNPSYTFTSQTTCCYKGIELRQAEKGGAYDNEIRRGIEQLRYAMPLVLTNAIMNNIMAHHDDNKPFILCSILVTDAELFVMHKHFTDNKLRAAKTLMEFGKPVSYLVTHSGYGPDFETHCTKTCNLMSDYVGYKKVREIDDTRGIISDAQYKRHGPIAFMNGLASADQTTLELNFSQFVVCTIAGFPRLVDKLKRLAVQVMESRTDMRTHRDFPAENGTGGS